MQHDPWFSREEFEQRVHKAQDEAARLGVDMILAFHPESVTYLTGHWTRGFQLFQFAIIPAKGEPTVVLRDVEEFHLNRRYAFSDRVFWSDGDVPREVAVAAIKRAGGTRARIGIETAYPLDVNLFEALKEGLPDAEFIDIGKTLATFREIKSPAEIDYMRRAGVISELGMNAGVAAIHEGANELDVASAASSAMIRAGSDNADPGPMASGERAGQIHSVYEDRVLKLGDDVHLEVNPCINYYYARFFRPIKVGRASEADHELAHTLLSIQDKAFAEVGPGVPAAVPDRIIREGFVTAGLRFPPPLDKMERYPNQSFYSCGFILPPLQHVFSATPKKQWTFQPGMTLHSYFFVRFPFSETLLITDTGYERLTNYPRELIVTPS